MDRMERFYRIDQLLRARRATPLTVLMEDLGVSRATVKRDLEYLRDRMAAPIVWDRAQRGYRYDTPREGDVPYALPGLWFNASEVHALLTMDHLLSSLQPGLLGPHISPLRHRIRRILSSGDHSPDEVERRIRVLHMAARQVESEVFEAISHALFKRRRVVVSHLNRRSGETTRRELSPQRVVHYRDNWYLDAWCHWREALRSFAVDAIEAVELLEQEVAMEVPEQELEHTLGAGYGIFAGAPVDHAQLRFSAESARWVSREKWHSAQSGRFDDAGRYLLTVPYSEDVELVMDILRYGPEVEVLAPAALREKVAGRLRSASDSYRD
jgi:predicted DNA-binding transcriptional regulator YafY